MYTRSVNRIKKKTLLDAGAYRNDQQSSHEQIRQQNSQITAVLSAAQDTPVKTQKKLITDTLSSYHMCDSHVKQLA
jgi:predicted RNA binding protein YcfA (HicA-like mRNA interferase family)